MRMPTACSGSISPASTRSHSPNWALKTAQIHARAAASVFPSGASLIQGHADHRNAELSVRMRAQPGPASRVKIGVALNHQQPQPADPVQHRTQRRQLPHEELTGPVRQHLGHDRSALGQPIHERGICGHHGRRPSAPTAQVMHIHSRAHVTARTAAGFHAYEDAPRDRKTDETPGSARMLSCPPEIHLGLRSSGAGEAGELPGHCRARDTRHGRLRARRRQPSSQAENREVSRGLKRRVTE